MIKKSRVGKALFGNRPSELVEEAGKYIELGLEESKTKALLPEGVEAVIISRNDYDRLAGDLTKENVELKLEVERLNNKVEELMTLYTTEREVKEDYKSIIKEVRKYANKYNDKIQKDILEILDKGEINE